MSPLHAVFSEISTFNSCYLLKWTVQLYPLIQTWPGIQLVMLLCPVHSRPMVSDQRPSLTGFTYNVDLLLPAVEAKRSARLKVTVRNSRSAHRELQAAKRTVQCLTRFAVSPYWENLNTRIQQCADCGDLHGLYSGIREAIGPIPKKLSPLLAADKALLVDTSAQLDR